MLKLAGLFTLLQDGMPFPRQGSYSYSYTYTCATVLTQLAKISSLTMI
jgi:hypothetical protein